MPHPFLHLGCNQDIARWVVSQTPGVSILDSQYSGLKLEAEHPLAQQAYFRYYYTQERLLLEQRLIDQIDESFETDNINPDLDDDEHC